jgi:N-acetylglutamate synthase-like GNAT family acetyltransferase
LPVIAKAKPELLALGTYDLALTPKGQIIGVGGWTKERLGAGGVVSGVSHIRRVATHPEWIGGRVGSLIIERSFAEAGADGIRCFESYASLNAVDFYRRLGFLEVCPIDVPMGMISSCHRC